MKLVDSTRYYAQQGVVTDPGPYGPHPWDTWNDLVSSENELPDEEVRVFDHLADLTAPGTDSFPEIRELYETDPGVRARAGWSPE